MGGSKKADKQQKPLLVDSPLYQHFAWLKDRLKAITAGHATSAKSSLFLSVMTSAIKEVLETVEAVLKTFDKQKSGFKQKTKTAYQVKQLYDQLTDLTTEIVDKFVKELKLDKTAQKIIQEEYAKIKKLKIKVPVDVRMAILVLSNASNVSAELKDVIIKAKNLQPEYIENIRKHLNGFETQDEYEKNYQLVVQSWVRITDQILARLTANEISDLMVTIAETLSPLYVEVMSHLNVLPMNGSELMPFLNPKAICISLFGYGIKLKDQAQEEKDEKAAIEINDDVEDEEGVLVKHPGSAKPANAVASAEPNEEEKPNATYSYQLIIPQTDTRDFAFDDLSEFATYAKNMLAKYLFVMNKIIAFGTESDGIYIVIREAIKFYEEKIAAIIDTREQLSQVNEAFTSGGAIEDIDDLFSRGNSLVEQRDRLQAAYRIYREDFALKYDAKAEVSNDPESIAKKLTYDALGHFLEVQQKKIEDSQDDKAVEYFYQNYFDYRVKLIKRDPLIVWIHTSLDEYLLTSNISAVDKLARIREVKARLAEQVDQLTFPAVNPNHSKVNLKNEIKSRCYDILDDVLSEAESNLQYIIDHPVAEVLMPGQLPAAPGGINILSSADDQDFEMTPSNASLSVEDEYQPGGLPELAFSPRSVVSQLEHPQIHDEKKLDVSIENSVVDLEQDSDENDFSMHSPRFVSEKRMPVHVDEVKSSAAPEPSVVRPNRAMHQANEQKSSVAYQVQPAAVPAVNKNREYYLYASTALVIVGTVLLFSGIFSGAGLALIVVGAVLASAGLGMRGYQAKQALFPSGSAAVAPLPNRDQGSDFMMKRLAIGQVNYDSDLAPSSVLPRRVTTVDAVKPTLELGAVPQRSTVNPQPFSH